MAQGTRTSVSPTHKYLYHGVYSVSYGSRLMIAYSYEAFIGHGNMAHAKAHAAIQARIRVTGYSCMVHNSRFTLRSSIEVRFTFCFSFMRRHRGVAMILIRTMSRCTCRSR